MRTVRFVIVGALGLFGASATAAPTTPARQPSKTSQDLLGRAEAVASKISNQLNDNRALQNHAREGRDMLRLGCVESQLAVSRALVEASEATIESLRATVRSGKDGDASFQVLVMLANESDASYRAAAACIGSHELATRIATVPAFPVIAPAAPGATTTATPKSGPAFSFLIPRTLQLNSVRTAPASP